MPTGAPDNPFWRFSLALYHDAEIAALCLRAQDEGGADVNLLLWAIWLATEETALDPPLLTAAVERTQAWTRAVVGPLRGVRRDLKTVSLGFDAAAFRRDVQALELEAERAVQAALAALAETWQPRRQLPYGPALDHNLAAVFRLWSADTTIRDALATRSLAVLAGR